MLVCSCCQYKLSRLDHEQLRHDPLIGAMLDRLKAGRKDCALLAGSDKPLIGLVLH